MDFGALLNQFQKNVKKVTSVEAAASERRSRDDGNDTTEQQRGSSKKCRMSHTSEQHLLDVTSFPPVQQVYIICPANVSTGGPEALHQLCDQINTGTDLPACMLYVHAATGGGGRKKKRLVHASSARKLKEYETYQTDASSFKARNSRNPLVDPLEKQSLLIWPECWTDEMMEFLNNTTSNGNGNSNSNLQCSIWWLSVNNNTGRFRDWHRKDILHLYQSEYAKHHLQKYGAKHIHSMTEYIPKRVLPPIIASRPSLPKDTNRTTVGEERSIDILYNPLKGMHYTDEIVKRSKHSLKLSPIGAGEGGRERISPEEVRAMLRLAKVYIDFGPHPGMDRLPREAAMAGCVIVTNTEGAAGYMEDVPIPSKYKIKNFDANYVHNLLQDIVDNFEAHSKEMDNYRDWIRGQKDTMKVCVKDFVQEIGTRINIG